MLTPLNFYDKKIDFDFNNNFIKIANKKNLLHDFLENNLKNEKERSIFKNAIKLEKIFFNKNISFDIFNNTYLPFKGLDEGLEIDIDEEFIQNFFEFNYKDNSHFAYGFFKWFIEDNPYDDVNLSKIPNDLKVDNPYFNGATIEIGDANFEIGNETFFREEIRERVIDIFEMDLDNLDKDMYDSFYYELLIKHSNIQDLIKEAIEENIENQFEDRENEESSDDCYINGLHEFLHEEGVFDSVCCEDDIEKYSNEICRF
jgi:hypothetical protein